MVVNCFFKSLMRTSHLVGTIRCLGYYVIRSLKSYIIRYVGPLGDREACFQNVYSEKGGGGNLRFNVFPLPVSYINEALHNVMYIVYNYN